MPLKDLHLPVSLAPLPPEVRRFLRAANRRVERFRRERPIGGFVPCDFERAYAVLHALAGSHLTAGNLFCEWGSGFGVVACLAAMLEFDACGIEIEPELVEAATQLADDFDLPVQFMQGSFIPRGAAIGSAGRSEYSWLATDEDDLELGPDDFDVIFAYPWPDEEQLAADLFERYARAGAVLVTYHGGEEFQLRRAVKRPASDRRGRNG